MTSENLRDGALADEARELKEWLVGAGADLKLSDRAATASLHALAVRTGDRAPPPADDGCREAA